MRLPLRAKIVLGLASCFGVLACSESAKSRPDAGAVSASPAANISVPLPDGWTASVDADRSFRAGPPDRAVLRIDFRKGAAKSIPSVDAMQEEFQAAAGRPVEVLEHVDEEGARLLYLALPNFDGGSAPVLLGARVSGEDLFLCSSLPGATDKEVHAAGEACRAISLKSAARP